MFIKYKKFIIKIIIKILNGFGGKNAYTFNILFLQPNMERQLKQQFKKLIS